jgi:CheY-like chemotaxis protein
MTAPQKPVILCVDDTPANLTLLNAILSPHYAVKLLNNGQKAIDFLSRNRVDLVFSKAKVSHSLEE